MTSSSHPTSSRLTGGVGYAIGLGVLLLAVVVVNLVGRDDGEPDANAPGGRALISPSPTRGSRIEVRPGMGDASTRRQPRGTAFTNRPPRTKQELRIESYQLRLPEVKRELAAFRDSNPVFEAFRQVVEVKVASIAIEGALAKVKMEERYGKKPKSDYAAKKEEAEEAIEMTVATLYGDVVRQALDYYQSGTVELGEKEEETWLSLMRGYEARASRTTGSLEYGCPFKEGTVEALQYKQRLGQAASELGRKLGFVLCKLPPDLEEKKKDLVKEYGGIWSRTPFSKRRVLPEKYVDEYARMFRRLGERTKEETVDYYFKRGKPQAGQDGN